MGLTQRSIDEINAQAELVSAAVKEAASKTTVLNAEDTQISDTIFAIASCVFDVCVLG